jgi:endonuclease/exonuclease/phosphatase family metal-dependent hydrolase
VIGEVTFGVIGLLFLFADIRTFSSTFQQTFYGNSTTQLAVMATAVFATSFLALLVAWRLGTARALGISSLAFVVATLLCTTSRNNSIDLVLSVIALAAGFWWLAFLHTARTDAGPSSPFVRALPVAFAIDLALRAAFRTQAVVDLQWSAAVGIVLVAALVFGASGLAILAPRRQWTAANPRGALGLLAVPCLIFVAESGATNGAQVALAAGLGLGPEGSRATQIGEIAVGVGLAAGALALTRYPARGVAIAAALVIGGALLWLHLPYVSLAGGLVLAAGAIAAGAALFAAPLQPSRSPAITVVALSLGWLLFAGSAFGFFAFGAYAPAVYAAIAIAAFGALVTPAATARLGRALALLVAIVAVGAPVASLVSTPALDDPKPPRVTFRFMTYNIHHGYNAGQVPSLDLIAETIAREDPDVICLQEVVRGWMIDDQHDALSILAERLGMRYAFLPNIGDLFGNAILSRFPITDVNRLHYAVEPGIKHQPRGALFARIADVTFACTHLDDVSDASIVRQEQIRTIIRNIPVELGPVIVAGDLNAVPGDIEVRLLGEFGLEDLGASAGDTTTNDTPQKRIDYVWGRGVVGAQAHSLPLPDAARASDHRPLIVNITVQK